MNRLDADGFKDAMDVELGTFTDMDLWTIVKQEDSMNFLGLTWAFKIKQFLNGTTSKLEACLCVCGDQQIDG
eukprot:4099999-Ditylum_brightwellii.AAC.1